MPKLVQEKPLVHTKSWKALARHQKTMAKIRMRDLFAKDKKRFDRFSVMFQDILVDFSKNRINADTMRLLLDLSLLNI